jgi:hypothetical protein
VTNFPIFVLPTTCPYVTWVFGDTPVSGIRGHPTLRVRATCLRNPSALVRTGFEVLAATKSSKMLRDSPWLKRLLTSSFQELRLPQPPNFGALFYYWKYSLWCICRVIAAFLPCSLGAYVASDYMVFIRVLDLVVNVFSSQFALAFIDCFPVH